jgi:hypothetical protein
MPTLNADTDAPSSEPPPDEQLLTSTLDRNADIDPDADVIIKSEWHFSTGDLREELKLIRTGAFDVVVFEAARENIEEVAAPTVSDRIVAFPFFFLSFLYTDMKPLLMAAVKQDADIRFTREADGDVIQGLPDTLHRAILGFVLALGVCIAYFAARAITQPPFAAASLAAFSGIFALPIVIRKARGKLASGETNRNEIMASRIEAIMDEEDAERVFVQLGASHAKPVRDRLPDTVDVSIVSPAYGFVSIPAMKEFVPGVGKSIVLFFAVWIALAVFGALTVLAAYGVVTVVV